MKKDIFKIENIKLKSRLIVGTGKYKSFRETAEAVKESGADMVTVAVRRVNILDKRKPILTDYVNPRKIIYLPNTAGCFSSEEAFRPSDWIVIWHRKHSDFTGTTQSTFTKFRAVFKSTWLVNPNVGVHS